MHRFHIPFARCFAAVLAAVLLLCACTSPAVNEAVDATQATPAPTPEPTAEPTPNPPIDRRGEALTFEDFTALAKENPDTQIFWDVPVYGTTADCTAEMLTLATPEERSADPRKEPERFSEESAAVLAALTQALPYFTQLKTVDLTACCLENTALDGLIAEYPEIRFIWTLHFSRYDLRTDATAFSTANTVKEGQSTKMHKERLTDADMPLFSYCTDLIALDLGHNYISDLSALAPLKNLQYLILADNKISDISVLADLKELIYIELFMNAISDVSPLADLPKLLDLNLFLNHIEDPTPLYPLGDTVERLWMARNRIDKSMYAEIEAAFPNATCILGYENKSSTGNGWRKHDRFFEMRELFGLPPIN